VQDLAVEATPAEATSQAKFGTFLGVYTPSILTILGVIMYQRFGWVVGNAGLGGAIGVVLLAHVISVTTGLSVASIATNHTVKTGGNYYIISRSLGLSIGGAIGLALYVALALGVSLYLIGFAEAFIAATGFTPVDGYTNNLRVIGSVALVLMALLTLYSTSIALKSQLFVLGAIVLSLVSIVAGSGVPAIAGETAVALTPPANAPAFAAVFAVFFPAVTGFTAGVGMSGDLKDPKRAIPIGTMAAIVTGLVIYLGLPFLLSDMATIEQLQQDNNILLRTSLSPHLVTAGVFAATLSSALGSILGAPRTLQALAFDGIVPRFLGRGREEPRVALVVTILIAEAGILVGELELVGSIISMFFLTCYGFLCLACGLERWASPDFRPQFRVPIWVSLLGAVACFMVMFQINALAMFGAIVIMGLIYLVLKRRQLVLQSGDTWGGVWSAVVRAGLLRLRQSDTTAATRNWRPNMILLSRGRRRRDMIRFGQSIVGDRGILTHFDLVPGAPRKARVDSALEAEYPGLFARSQGCDNPYTAIPNLVSSFGLAGMESNVVLLGWPREAGHRIEYADMTTRLLELDISVLMLRLDDARGFGKRERIDIWWDGEAPTGPLMLTLAHMILTSAQWKHSKLRILVNGRRGADEADAKKRLEAMIEDARVTAEAVLLAPLSEEGSLADRIRQESQFADLVMVHALEATDDEGFVQRNDAVLAPLGTALLVRPAKIFSEAPVIFEKATAVKEHTDTFDILDVAAPAIPELESVTRRLVQQLTEATERFHTSVQVPSMREENVAIDAVAREVRQITQLERRLARRGGRREAARGLVDWAKSRFATSAMERIRPLRDGVGGREPPWPKRTRDGINRLRSDVWAAVQEVPEWVLVPTDAADWESRPNDRFGVRLEKLRVRLGIRWLHRRPPPRRVPARQVALHHLGPPFLAHLDQAVRQVGVRRFDAIRRVRRLAYDTDRFFANLLAELDSDPSSTLDVAAFSDLVARELISLLDVAEGVKERFESSNEASFRSARLLVARTAQRVVAALEREDIVEQAAEWSPSKEQRQSRKAAQALDELPALWRQQHDAIVSALELDLLVASLTIDSRRALYQLFQRVRRELEQGPIAAIESAEAIMQRVIELREQAEEVSESTPAEPAEPEAPAEAEAEEGPDFEAAFLAAADELRSTWEQRYRPEPRELFDNLLASLARAAEKLPSQVTTSTERALDAAAEGNPEREKLVYPVRRLAQVFVEKQLAEPARVLIDQLPRRVRDAQEALVDGVRLVAFELEQAATSQDEDPDAAGPLALGGVVEDRLGRLAAARKDIEGYVVSLRAGLLEDAARSLEGARDAVIGAGSSAVSSPGRVQIPSESIVRGASRAFERARGRVERKVDEIAQRRVRGVKGTSDGTLLDELLELREALTPQSEVQASLPLIYRRLFGRAALETSDLLVGRRMEIARVTQMVERWGGTASGPIAIVGAPRSGRTSMANIVARELLPEATVVRVNAPAGGTASPDAVNEAVTSALQAREGQSAEGALRALPPGAVVLIDDLGRWIERAPGGLAALQQWMKLFRRLGDRHLFLLTSTDVAWRYADELLQLQGSFLGAAFLRPLAKRQMIEMLSLRQRTSDFDLNFERRRFSAVRSLEDRRHLTALYDRARGNVGDAIDLWRRSIVSVGERQVTLSVRPAPDASVLMRLPLKWYAALANVMLHRSVTAQRMARICRVGREEAMGLLGDLERAGLLASDKNGAWSIDPLLQPLVLEALANRGVLA
jgi:amino acid transporter